jgi:hypothetical protein
MTHTGNGLWNFSSHGREAAGLLHVRRVGSSEMVRDRGGWLRRMAMEYREPIVSETMRHQHRSEVVERASDQTGMHSDDEAT